VGEKEEICHKKAIKISAPLIPVKRENNPIRHGNEINSPAMPEGASTDRCIKVRLPVEKEE
jgi:hypothetical protein